MTIRGAKPNSQSGHGFTRCSVVTMRQTWDLCYLVLFAEDSGATADLPLLLRLFVLQPQDGLRMTAALPPSSFFLFSVDRGWHDIKSRCKEGI